MTLQSHVFSCKIVFPSINNYHICHFLTLITASFLSLTRNFFYVQHHISYISMFYKCLNILNNLSILFFSPEAPLILLLQSWLIYCWVCCTAVIYGVLLLLLWDFPSLPTHVETLSVVPEICCHRSSRLLEYIFQ